MSRTPAAAGVTVASMSRATSPRGFLRAADCNLDEFRAVVEVDTDPADHPLAERIDNGVPVYSAADLRDRIAGGLDRRVVEGEIAASLLAGPGTVVVTGAMDPTVVDRASTVFFDLIDQQNANGRSVGDHYAKPGANDRVWNSFEKHAIADPESFVAYYSNDIISLVATAWLGPAYQMSAQVNVVNPGGDAQMPHRDYHLGFLTDAVAETYPAHAHVLSPALTLQGAVAHCDMPVESGPTFLLPHSQKYPAGYLAWRRPEFIEYFRGHYVQSPLAKGDLLFFNPALFHAGGRNETAHIRRMANLLQISSSMARAMETIDTARITRAVYPAILRAKRNGLAADLVENVVATCSEGYAFPSNLDRDPPTGGLTPPSQTDVVRRAVAEEWDPERLDAELSEHAAKRSSLDPW